ncbi:MAG: site-specific integrase [Oscillospiraceae bacterium]|nr:site-specific integrase [Oscillospiraceae bacterium]
MDNRKLKKQRETAAKLSRPRPVELPSGKWRCQVMVDGKRFDVIEDDPATAHAKALAVKAGLLEQEKSPKDLTVGEVIDRYIESKDAVLSPSTVAGYKKMRKSVLQGIMDIKLRDITQEDIQREVNRMSRVRSPKYVRNAHGLLSAALSVYRPSLVLRTTMPQKQKKVIAIPTTEEIRLIAETAKGSRFELPFLLAAWMGLRTSEIRGLTWDCIEGEYLHIKQALVDGENGPVLKKTKTYSGDRRIKIPGYIMDLLEQQAKTDDYILKVHRGQLYATLDRYCAKCGLRHYRFHDLRHYQASVMLALGIPDKYAMERMGHSSTNMLKNVYQHTMISKEEEVSVQVDNYFEENLHTDLHTGE